MSCTSLGPVSRGRISTHPPTFTSKMCTSAHQHVTLILVSRSDRVATGDGARTARQLSPSLDVIGRRRRRVYGQFSGQDAKWYEVLRVCSLWMTICRSVSCSSLLSQMRDGTFESAHAATKHSISRSGGQP